jgi:hypothetical protein
MRRGLAAGICYVLSVASCTVDLISDPMLGVDKCCYAIPFLIRRISSSPCDLVYLSCCKISICSSYISELLQSRHFPISSVQLPIYCIYLVMSNYSSQLLAAHLYITSSAMCLVLNFYSHIQRSTLLSWTLPSPKYSTLYTLQSSQR